MTDGWYCVDLDGHEVLRYSEHTVRELRGDTDDGQPSPYVNYFVVRLWEDVIELVSEAMEPVPPDLVDIASDNSPDWEWQDAPEEADAAMAWHSEGFLYTSYLRIAPLVRCWRTIIGEEDSVTLTWEHQADPEGVIEFAGPQRGRVSMPTGEFLAAVTELDRGLLAAMDQRITELEAAPVPGADLDVEQLRCEHRHRATRLRRAQTHEPRTDWDAVRTGLRMLLAPGVAAQDGEGMPGA